MSADYLRCEMGTHAGGPGDTAPAAVGVFQVYDPDVEGKRMATMDRPAALCADCVRFARECGMVPVEVVRFFVTTTANMPLGTGYVEIEAETREEARALAFKYMPDGRWSFDYASLEDIHPMDRNKRGHITGLHGFRSE